MGAEWEEVFEKATEHINKLMNDYKPDIDHSFSNVDTGKPFSIDLKVKLTQEADGGINIDTEISFVPMGKIKDHVEEKIGGKQQPLPLG